MENTLTAICVEIHNYFTDPSDIHRGRFTVENGSIVAPFLSEGQFYRVVGSIYNDGVYQYPAPELEDETFDGAIWAMKVPPVILEIAAEIEKYNADASNSVTPYVSESFGGYSYTRATDANGVAAGWRTIFAPRLNRWRKLP